MTTVRLLAAGLTAGLLTACTGGPLGESPEDMASAATQDFLDRWSSGDVAQAARQTDAPAAARELLSDVQDTLQITRTTYEPAGAATCSDSRCTQRVRLTHTLDGIGEWSYATTVRVTRPADDEAEGFVVAWSPQVVHPRLTDQTELSRERTLPGQGVDPRP